MEIEELTDIIPELEGKIEPTDGVMVLIVGFNKPIEIVIPQIGLMSAAHIERQIPRIFQAISIRRADETRKEQQNATREQN